MEMVLRRVSEESVRGTIEADHYLHRWPDPRSVPFAYEARLEGEEVTDARPHGILVFKLLQHKRQRGLFGYPGLPTEWQVLDLARVWVHPDLQARTWWAADRTGQGRTMRLNLFSRMVGASFRRVQRDWIDHHPPPYPEMPYHVELILSYCDREHHHGTGYRASGMEYFGPSTDGTKDLYVRRLRRPRWQYVSPQPKLLEVALA